MCKQSLGYNFGSGINATPPTTHAGALTRLSDGQYDITKVGQAQHYSVTVEALALIGVALAELSTPDNDGVRPPSLDIADGSKVSATFAPVTGTLVTATLTSQNNLQNMTFDAVDVVCLQDAIEAIVP